MKYNKKYYSQYQQDRYIDFFFSKKSKGIFLDIGANDGISLSNTYFFEKERSWSGICIEPIPSSFEKLKANRNCILENCCVLDKENVVTFREVTGPSEMLSGILNFFDDTHINRINNEIELYGGTYRDIQIQAKNLNNILKQNNLCCIDYCSIDTEGAEEFIVKSIDFDKYKINAFTIENNNKDNAVRVFLKQKGYKCVSSLCDDFFFKKGMPRFYRTMFLIYLYKFSEMIQSLLRKLKLQRFVW
jgi:FkbM family methyltransferase